MRTLVLLHILSAFIGLGPTYFTAILLRRSQTPAALRHNLALSETMSFFPKIGGTLAVLSGLALIWRGHYGPVTQLWLLGSLALYALIQIVIIGYAVPRTGRLAAWVGSPAGSEVGTLPGEQAAVLSQLQRAHLLVGALGAGLLVLMILKPH
ncbi:DUF2269 family protein [Deinococcus sp. Arct2-2]|uniref:DUF2269 family protein n=1 Tax=Deinococcus sp. Arct2-2 TaxID=2568653 RepID=UPI001454C2E9|nr:DUF2269 family protein [Deinococcus sp. Arct2-2]